MKNKVTTGGVDSTMFNNMLFMIFVANFTAEDIPTKRLMLSTLLQQKGLLGEIECVSTRPPCILANWHCFN